MIQDPLLMMKKVRKDKTKTPKKSKGDNDDQKPPVEVVELPDMVQPKPATLDIRKRFKEENAFIGNILSLLHVPKHHLHDSDEEDVGDVPAELRKKYKGNSRAGNVGELEERLRAKLADMGCVQGGNKRKGSKQKLTKVEKRQKSKEEKRLKAKLLKSAASKTTSSTLAKPVYNSEGKMVFSKFDFTNGDAGRANKKKVDDKTTLVKVQKNKEKIKSLEAKGDSEKVKQLVEETAWSSALEKSAGVKVKDDVTLLKKSIKKQEQRKKSSKKKWDARQESEDKRKDARQHKRSENINKRKQDKKQNKMKKLAKKGRSVPGFR